MQLQIAKTTILLLFIMRKGVTGLPASTHCAAKFQETLQEAMELKRNCEEAHFRDCCQITDASKMLGGTVSESGVYDISNIYEKSSPFTQTMQARCDMKSSNGGWTVLIRRTPDIDERVLFNRTWVEYENGFGDLNTEFWYGLKNMHRLTTREPMEVEVELNKRDGTKLLLPYGEFKVDSPGSKYVLHVSDKQHNKFDFLGNHNGMKFTTFDQDNDQHGNNCAKLHNDGGWWFNSCHRMHLTDSSNPQLYKERHLHYDYAELRVRPKSCECGIREA